MASKTKVGMQSSARLPVVDAADADFIRSLTAPKRSAQLLNPNMGEERPTFVPWYLKDGEDEFEEAAASSYGRGPRRRR